MISCAHIFSIEKYLLYNFLKKRLLPFPANKLLKEGFAFGAFFGDLAFSPKTSSTTQSEGPNWLIQLFKWPSGLFLDKRRRSNRMQFARQWLNFGFQALLLCVGSFRARIEATPLLYTLEMARGRLSNTNWYTKSKLIKQQIGM